MKTKVSIVVLLFLLSVLPDAAQSKGFRSRPLRAKRFVHPGNFRQRQPMGVPLWNRYRRSPVEVETADHIFAGSIHVPTDGVWQPFEGTGIWQEGMSVDVPPKAVQDFFQQQFGTHSPRVRIKTRAAARPRRASERMRRWR